MPKVSCVLPVYNGLPYLTGAVESVLKQDFPDFELLLIDDGSTDGSGEVCAQLAARDSRVQVINQANAGIVASLNRGVARAEGEYIARMDADDLCRPDRFSRQVAFLNANVDVVAVGTRQAIIDSDGRILHYTRGNRWRDALTFPAGGIALCHPSVMFRRAIFKRTRGYSEEFHAAEDYALWFEMARFGRVCEMSEYLLDYRVHSNNTSLVKLTQQRESCLKAELAYQARIIARDEGLAKRFESASNLESIAALLPVQSTQVMPSQRAVITYLNSQVVKRLANRAAITPLVFKLVELQIGFAVASPRLLNKQDRSTLRAGFKALASAAWALGRRTKAKLMQTLLR